MSQCVYRRIYINIFFVYFIDSSYEKKLKEAQRSSKKLKEAQGTKKIDLKNIGKLSCKFKFLGNLPKNIEKFAQKSK